MPILRFHLVEEHYTDAQCEALLVQSSQFYADVLQSPIERIRVFIDLYRPGMAAVGGSLVSKCHTPAPYFEFLVLEGRPLEVRQRLQVGFTDLIERILFAPRGLIRGVCWSVPPDDWSIGGESASTVRAAEVKARSQGP